MLSHLHMVGLYTNNQYKWEKWPNNGISKFSKLVTQCWHTEIELTMELLAYS